MFNISCIKEFYNLNLQVGSLKRLEPTVGYHWNIVYMQYWMTSNIICHPILHVIQCLPFRHSSTFLPLQILSELISHSFYIFLFEKLFFCIKLFPYSNIRFMIYPIMENIQQILEFKIMDERRDIFILLGFHILWSGEKSVLFPTAPR